jgi:hypothetical protein
MFAAQRVKKCNAIWHISMLAHMSDQCRFYHHRQTAECEQKFFSAYAGTNFGVSHLRKRTQIPLNICNAAIQNLCSF